MELRERREICDEILSRQLNWIAAAETRINLLLTVETGMLAGIVSVYMVHKNTSTLVSHLSSTAGALLSGALVCLAVVRFPRTDGPQESVIFFGAIASRSKKHYIETMSKISSADYLTDLCQQIHRNAEIAGAKFTWIKRSLDLLWVAMPLWIAGVALLISSGR